MMSEKAIRNLFSHNVRKLRRAHGLTMQGLANECGVTLRTVSSWENEGNIPNSVTMMKLGEILVCDNPYDLLTCEFDVKVSFTKERV